MGGYVAGEVTASENSGGDRRTGRQTRPRADARPESSEHALMSADFG